ncbi:MAG: inorganic phosphate transporter, partial [Roseibium sp.]|nr:inorganic phosphate transporter [Roseibium sp.]
MKPKALDKDLDRLGFLGDAAEAMGRRLTGPGLAIVFLALCAVVAGSQVVTTDWTHVLFLVAASVVGGHMALNIGANDVANNVGPAVGARVVSLTTALIIAAVCESAGALLAGSRVVSTISGSILSPADVPDNSAFMLAMLTAMAAAALWINVATLIGAPVSTTHSIIGGVVGAGIAVSGFAAINWTTVSAIAATWVVSPFLGGVIAAILMAFINTRLIYAEHKVEAAKLWLPLLLGGMAATFVAFLANKTADRMVQVEIWQIAMLALVADIAVWWLYNKIISAQALELDNSTKSLRTLFTFPLILTAGLLSFAHGANDVANAIGPLAAILHSAQYGDVAAKVDTPLWVML